jgi:Predicted membrane protein
MKMLELFFIAVGLSMDAFAVSICQGVSMRKANFKKLLIIGLYFGIFQAGMPVIGYLIGSQFAASINAFDHWIAFVLLSFIGIKMIMESFKKEASTNTEEVSLKMLTMLPLAIATSIDALAVGISFAIIQVEIVPAISFIGITTLLLSMVGVKIGNLFGSKSKAKAELAGGIILILMGFKILLEHLEFFIKIYDIIDKNH